MSLFDQSKEALCNVVSVVDVGDGEVGKLRMSWWYCSWKDENVHTFASGDGDVGGDHWW